jgi:hypothetical protein
LRIVGGDVKDVAPGHAGAAELASVAIIPDLEHMTGDAVGVAREESLDVIAVDRESAVPAEFSTDRRQLAEVAEGYVTDRWVHLAPLPPLREPMSRGSRNCATRSSREDLPGLSSGNGAGGATDRVQYGMAIGPQGELEGIPDLSRVHLLLLQVPLEPPQIDKPPRSHVSGAGHD